MGFLKINFNPSLREVCGEEGWAARYRFVAPFFMSLNARYPPGSSLDYYELELLPLFLWSFEPESRRQQEQQDTNPSNTRARAPNGSATVAPHRASHPVADVCVCVCAFMHGNYYYPLSHPLLLNFLVFLFLLAAAWRICAFLARRKPTNSSTSCCCFCRSVPLPVSISFLRVFFSM